MSSLPLVGQSELMYSQECDESTIASLQAQVDAFLADITTQGVRAAVEPEVQLICRALYHGFTTAAGRVTIGEEYADVLPVMLQNAPQGSASSISVARLLNGWPRLLAVVLRAACPWLQARWVFFESKLAGALRSHRSRAALRPVLRFALRLGAVVKRYSSALSQVHILLFYLLGEYFLLSNRFLGIRYVKRTPRHLSFPMFPLRIVGILQLLRLVIIAVKDFSRAIAQRRAALSSSNVQFTDGISLAAASRSAAAAEDAEDADSAVGDAPACPLCLSSRKQAACTPCGHVFCWRCIAEWLVKKPECPLCRCTPQRRDGIAQTTFNFSQEFVWNKQLDTPEVL